MWQCGTNYCNCILLSNEQILVSSEAESTVEKVYQTNCYLTFHVNEYFVLFYTILSVMETVFICVMKGLRSAIRHQCSSQNDILDD